MMKKIFTAICLLAITSIGAVSANAQGGAAITFKNTVHDFGEIVESDGPVTCAFEFTNTGDQPLVINSVNASCGCTSPGYTREPIAPGGKGEVKATFNPAGRVAPFDKTLTVNTNGKPARIVLHIKGKVLPKPVDLKKVYPVTIGNLRLKQTNVEMGGVLSDASRVILLETANTEEGPISFTFDKVPEYIQIVGEPSKLEPKQQGKIRITFDGTKKKDFGYSKDDIEVKVGSQKGTISVTTLLQEKMAAPANNEIANQAPRVSMKNKTFDYGTVAKGKTVTASYEIVNEGKNDLVINNVTANKSGFKSSVKKGTKIKSGKSAVLKFTYTPNEQGNNVCNVYVATNDPGNTILTLGITGTVN